MAINTIGGLIEHHIRLTAWCNACRHHDVLDLDALGQRLGFERTDDPACWGSWALSIASG